MRRFFGMAAAFVTIVAFAPTAKAQVYMPGDPVGFGRNGISNGLGYGVNSPRGAGYYPGLYNPTDNQGPSFYFDPVWNGLHAAPLPQAAQNGWKWSPPWSSSYRQGAPRKKLFARLHKDD